MPAVFVRDGVMGDGRRSPAMRDGANSPKREQFDAACRAVF
jgi:hypothetical protein